MSIAAPMVLKLYIFSDYKRKTNIFYSIFEEKKIHLKYHLSKIQTF